MKGKKIDNEFLSKFISGCIENNLISSEDILNKAKAQLDSIDFKIKEVERLKPIRSKLLDVIETFENKSKNTINLNYYNINKNISRNLFELMNCGVLKIKTIELNEDIIFCIKQLIQNNVLKRKNDILLKGEMFEKFNEEYLK